MPIVYVKDSLKVQLEILRTYFEKQGGDRSVSRIYLAISANLNFPNVFYFVNSFYFFKHSLIVLSRSSRSTFEATETN